MQLWAQEVFGQTLRKEDVRSDSAIYVDERRVNGSNVVGALRCRGRHFSVSVLGFGIAGVHERWGWIAYTVGLGHGYGHGLTLTLMLLALECLLHDLSDGFPRGSHSEERVGVDAWLENAFTTTACGFRERRGLVLREFGAHYGIGVLCDAA